VFWRKKCTIWKVTAVLDIDLVDKRGS